MTRLMSYYHLAAFIFRGKSLQTMAIEAEDTPIGIYYVIITIIQY